MNIPIFKPKIPIPFPLQPRDIAGDGNGVWTFLLRKGDFLTEVKKYYGRENSKKLCVKIIKNPIPNKKTAEQHLWGPSPAKGSPLKEALTVQNIYALYNLAPRAYGILEIQQNDKRYAAFLTEDLGHMINPPRDNSKIRPALNKIAKENQLIVFDDGRGTNVIGDKYVDFQGFRLRINYLDGLKKRVTGVANCGKWGPWQNYHYIPELDIKGARNLEHRIEKMELDKIHFKNQLVLDIGCSEGAFCKYASDQGAMKVVGIDLPPVAQAAAELAYYRGYFNMDFVGLDLKKESLEKVAPMGELDCFDIIFFFSMGQHVGYLKELQLMTKELLVFEGNGKNRDGDIQQKLDRDFITEHKGVTSDLFNRPIVWASSIAKVAGNHSSGGWLWPKEINILASYVSTIKNGIIFEIGTACGYSAMALALASKTSTVYTLDNYCTWFAKDDKVTDLKAFQELQRKDVFEALERCDKQYHLGVSKRVKQIIADSYTYEWKYGEIDFMFIDGNHTYEGVKNDFERFSPYLKKNGFIIFHDYQRCKGVKKYVDTLQGVVPKFNGGIAIWQKK